MRRSKSRPPRPATPPEPEQAKPAKVEGPANVDAPTTPRARLLAVADTLTVDDEVAVLLEHQLLRLGPIASAIVELLLEHPRDVDTLTVALEERFGAPADGSARDAVEEQLRALAERGVVALD